MSEIKPHVTLASIAAMAQNRVIGNADQIPWHIPEDFQFFKKTTMDHPMIMGRKTFESLPGVLKGRTHIVISRDGYDHPEAIGATSLEEAIEKGKELAQRDGQDEVFIIGGGEIYKQTLSIIDRLYLTLVHQQYEGDTYFPEFDWGEWNIASADKHEGSSEGEPAYTFFTLERK
ncbi:MAG: dihydrofolate reductase [Micavibrio sp.]|nr:MAG: dihydrofolate reductase [Micavibrio sp.]